MTILFEKIQHQLTPGVQIETDWTGAQSTLAGATKKTLLVAHMTTGTASMGEVHLIGSETEAIDLWGKGSELAVMAAAFLKNSPRTPLYGMAYEQGASAIAALGTVTLLGDATSSGTLTVWVAGRRFQIGIAPGDTPLIVADRMTKLINAHRNLPAVAENFLSETPEGVVSELRLTARNTGPQGKTIAYRSKLTASGMTATDGGAQLAVDTSSGDPTAVLSCIEGLRYHLIAFNAFDDSTTLGTLTEHMEKQSEPAVQKWGIGIVGHSGTRSNAETLADADDSYRSQIAWLRGSEEPCYEVAAAFAAQRAARDPRLSLDNVTLKGISAPSNRALWPSNADIESALAGGVTPLRPLENGDVEVVRSVITRQSATIAFRDHNVAEISDYVDETIIAKFRARHQGKPLKSGSPPGTPITVTPGRATATLNETLIELDNADYLQGVEDAKEAGRNFAEVNRVDPCRVDVAFDFWPITHAHNFAMKKSYRTTSP